MIPPHKDQLGSDVAYLWLAPLFSQAYKSRGETDRNRQWRVTRNPRMSPSNPPGTCCWSAPNEAERGNTSPWSLGEEKKNKQWSERTFMLISRSRACGRGTVVFTKHGRMGSLCPPSSLQLITLHWVGIKWSTRFDPLSLINPKCNTSLFHFRHSELTCFTLLSWHKKWLINKLIKHDFIRQRINT